MGHGPNQNKWIQVRLIKTDLPPFVRTVNTELAFAEWMAAIGLYGLTHWGKWSTVDNSVSGDTSYQIGGAHPTMRFWAVSCIDKELKFFEYSKWVGGGLKYGELETRFQVALELYGARVNTHGIEPALQDPGDGFAKLGTGFFSPGRVTWTSA
jgi:hypothetical protein